MNYLKFIDNVIILLFRNWYFGEFIILIVNREI